MPRASPTVRLVCLSRFDRRVNLAHDTTSVQGPDLRVERHAPRCPWETAHGQVLGGTPGARKTSQFIGPTFTLRIR